MRQRGLGFCAHERFELISGRSNRRFGGPVERGGMARLTVNGRACDVDVDSDTPLLWVLRDRLDLDVPQCGYCQSGVIMTVAALLRDKPSPTDAEIDAAITNICRCGTYQRIRAAIHAAAGRHVSGTSSQ